MDIPIFDADVDSSAVLREWLRPVSGYVEPVPSPPPAPQPEGWTVTSTMSGTSTVIVWTATIPMVPYDSESDFIVTGLRLVVRNTPPHPASR